MATVISVIATAIVGFIAGLFFCFIMEPKTDFMDLMKENQRLIAELEKCKKRERVLVTAATEAFAKWNRGIHEEESEGMIKLKNVLAQAKEGENDF